MEGEGDTERLRLAKKGKGGTHGVSHDGGDVAAGQSSAEAGRRGARGRKPEEMS
jgi:hypothetical protein